MIQNNSLTNTPFINQDSIKCCEAFLVAGREGGSMLSTRTEGRGEPVVSGKRSLVRGCRMRTVIAGLVGLIFVAQAGAAEVSIDNPPKAGFAADGVRHVVVTMNKSRTFRADKPFTKAIVGASEIVDVLPMSDQVLFLQGKKLGTTNVSIFDADAQLIEILDVEVAIDTAGMQQKIQASTGSQGYSRVRDRQPSHLDWDGTGYGRSRSRAGGGERHSGRRCG